MIDNADDKVYAQIPEPSKEMYTQWLQQAEKNCFARGLTTITDCGLCYRDVEAIDALQKEGKLNMRLYVMLSDEPANLERYLKKGPYRTDKLLVKGVKVYADGTLWEAGAPVFYNLTMISRDGRASCCAIPVTMIPSRGYWQAPIFKCVHTLLATAPTAKYCTST